MSRRVKDLLKENNRMNDLLSEEGQHVLTDIIVYLRGMPITMYQQEMIRSDVTRMLIDGEQRGSSANDVIGPDYREFCDNIVKELPPLSVKEKILGHIRDLLPAMIVLLVIWTFGSSVRIAAGIFRTFYCPVTAGDLLSGLLIIFAAERLINYLCRHSFQDTHSWDIGFGVLIAVTLVLSLIVKMILTFKLFYIHLALAALIILVLFLIYKIVDKYTD